MKKTLAILILIIGLASCQPTKRTVNTTSILAETALKYKGVPYKYGGVTTAGMDCSGLVYKAFSDLGIPFKRNSFEQSSIFRTIHKTDIRVGDLVYFKIGKGSKIDHTGIVTQISHSDVIMFIHSSSSAGVREDNMNSNYWKPKFVKATRPIL